MASPNQRSTDFMFSASMGASLILMSRVILQAAERFPEPQNFVVSEMEVWREYAKDAVSHASLEPLIRQSFEYMADERMIRIGRAMQGTDGFTTVTGYEGVRLTPEMLAVVNGGAPTAKTSPTLGHSLSTAIEQRQWQKANQVFCRIIMDLVALRNRGQLPL